MIIVKYEICEDETGKVVTTTEHQFADHDERRNWELIQNQHPWLHLKRTAIIDNTETSKGNHGLD